MTAHAIRRWIAALLLLPMGWLHADADPRWTVLSWWGNLWDGDDEGAPIVGSRFVYLVRNTSPPGAAYSLVTFTVPAGSDLGVSSAASDWEDGIADIQPDRTVFSGRKGIAPTGSLTFYLYSTLVGVNTNAWADAMSDLWGPFAPTPVWVPAPVPPVLTGVQPTSTGAWLTVSSLVWASINAVQRSQSVTGGWHNVACFVASGDSGYPASTNLFLPGTASNGFFRVRSWQGGVP